MVYKRKQSKRQMSKKKMIKKSNKYGVRRYRAFAPLKIANSIRKIQKFRYTEFFALSPGTGTIGKYIFSANSIYDPNVTGVGHQPLKFDQLAAFFSHYIVIGSKITVKLIGTQSTSASNIPFVWGVTLDDDASTPSDYRTIVEQGRSPYRINNGSNANLTQRCTNKFSCKRFFSVSNPKDNVTRLGAEFTANPTDQAYYTIWAQATDQTGTPPGLNYVVSVDYIALLSEGKDLPGS